MENKLFNKGNYNFFNKVVEKVEKGLEEKKLNEKLMTETGRIYIHGNKLEQTEFVPGARYNIYPNQSNDSLAIVIAEDGKYKVSKRTITTKSGQKVTSIIDLKSKDVKNMFKGFEIGLRIYKDCIVVSKTKNKVSDTANIRKANKAMDIKGKILSIMPFKEKKQHLDVNIDVQNSNIYMQLASGGEFQTVQMSLFDNLVSPIETISTGINFPMTRSAKEMAAREVLKPMRMASFFCGMGGLDLAFKMLGYEGVFALDKSFYKDTAENREKYGKENCSILEDYHIQTYRKNIGDYVVKADFLDYPIERIPDFEIGTFGIPCVELSSVSPSRNKFNMLPKFIDRFIEVIKAKKDVCKVWVIENSINLLSAGREFLEKIKDALGSVYDISENGVDAAEFGAGQHRERAIIIGSTIGHIELKKPILKAIKTVGDCFKGLNDSIPNQLDYSKAKEDTVFRMSFVKPGGNWQDVPEEYRKKGKFANYMRRLSLNETSIAIANIRKSLITHPTENRILSVRECLRLFGLPDTFECVGTLASKQQMVCNSVPFELSHAIAKTIKAKFEEYYAYNSSVATF